MRICTIAFTAVIVGIVLGALFVFSGSAAHITAHDRVAATATATVVALIATPADADEGLEDPPVCVVYVAARALI